MRDLEYDDKELQLLFRAMEPRERGKAMRGAFRRTAYAVKKIAERNLDATGLHNAHKMHRHIRAIVFKRMAGCRITIGTRKGNAKTGKGELGMHRNRYGIKKPVIIWAEAGTVERQVRYRGQKFVSMKSQWATAGKSRGSMPALRFMDDTLAQTKDTQTATLQRTLRQTVTEEALKHGCQ